MAICMHGQEVLACDHKHSRTWQRESPELHSLTRNTSLGHRPRSSCHCQSRRHSVAMCNHMDDQSHFCLLNIIFGCVSTEFSIRFSARSFPNRIECSSLLNFSNGTFKCTTKTLTYTDRISHCFHLQQVLTGMT